MNPVARYLLYFLGTPLRRLTCIGRKVGHAVALGVISLATAHCT